MWNTNDRWPGLRALRGRVFTTMLLIEKALPQAFLVIHLDTAPAVLEQHPGFVTLADWAWTEKQI